MTIELPQPSKEYNISRERVRNSRIQSEFNRKLGREEFNLTLIGSPYWPPSSFASGIDAGFSVNENVDGGAANTVHTLFIDGGVA